MGDISKSQVKEAYEFSKERHKGYKRINGKDYFEHPKNVYKILLKRKSDDATLCGALLHDLIEDTNTDLGEIREKFGEETAFLVDGMTKIKGFGNYLKKFEEHAKKDKRILLVKLADLEENLSVIDFIKEERLRVEEKYTRMLNLISRLADNKEEKKWAEMIFKKAALKFKKFRSSC